MSWSLASWNVLADAYLRPAWYRGVDPARLDPAWRGPAVVRRAAGLTADVLCLQEVEATRFQALQAALQPLGHEGRLLLKTGRPDGCATFVRPPLRLLASRELRYPDGLAEQGEAGHVALLVVLEHEGRRLGVANTHLRWAAPELPPGEHIGVRQAGLLCEALAREQEIAAWVVCGDLNAAPGSDVLAVLTGAGLIDPWGQDPAPPTCVANGRARRIDHVLHGAALRARPWPASPLCDATLLPAPGEPSDHVPIGVDFE